MAKPNDGALDDSIPEMVYQCISSVDTSEPKRDEFEKCPLCWEFRKIFYCVECVRNGNFTHSRKKCFERYADKKLRQYEVKEEISTILKMYKDKFERKMEAQKIKFDILNLENKIDIIRRKINASKKELDLEEKKVQVLTVANDRAKNKWRDSRKNVVLAYNKFVTISNRLKSGRSKLTAERSALDTLIQHRIKELETYIFSITKVMPRLEKEVEDLEEAQKTTYVQGQWVITGSPMDEMQYSVVYPRVPCTGDYSAYLSWCEERESISLERADWTQQEKKRRDVAYGISAGLAYASQFANIIAFYMDERVPKRSSFFDFCRYDGVSKFNHQVAKLNSNVVHLCLRRRVEVSQLSAHRSISNLLLLVDPEDKTRCISPEMEEQLLDSLEDSIGKDLLFMEDSEDDLDKEFVHVSEEEFSFEESEDVLPRPEIQEYSTNLFSSVMSSLYKAATWK